MQLTELFANKTLKPKKKTETLSNLLLDKSITIAELLAFAENQKDPTKASCIEALEFASKRNPAIADLDVLTFATQNLKAKAPRIKWESAKVIGNIASQFPNDLNEAIAALLSNTEHEGTVVRWSAAFALGEILMLKNSKYVDLYASLESICEREEKNSIKKIYLNAMKKFSKK